MSLQVTRRMGSEPRPIWLTVPGLCLQLGGMFVLPFVVGLMTALAFEVSQVVDTLAGLLTFTIVLLFPVALAQAVGMLLKSAREMRYHHQRRTLTLSRMSDILYTHTRVITGRGWSLLFMGLFFVVLALGMKWASLGVMAVIGLFLFYALVGWTIFTSTFFVRTFESRIGRSDSGIERTVQPAVCVTGTAAEEVFVFRKIPVPLGYNLLVEERLPDRLGGESRYQVGGAAGTSEIERRGRLRHTPRGVYRLGPAQLWYQDLLGITKISVASMASADLKVLPKIRPVRVIEPPRTTHTTPDVKTRPHRFATEDYFRFREYVPGDDSRRLHWKLSMKTGSMQVRLPETKEITKRDVLIVLDSYVPTRSNLDASLGGENLLDQVVEVALGLTRTLVTRGDRVRLIAAALTPEFRSLKIEELDARPGTAPRWQDLGARVQWQSNHDVPELLETLGEKGHAIVVTARFSAPPPSPEGAISTTWVFMDPATAFQEDRPPWWREVMARPGHPLFAFITRPNPVGSDDNALLARIMKAARLKRTSDARRRLRRVALRRMGQTQAELSRRGDSVYRIEMHPTGPTLRGLSGPGGLA